jgi:hypothetical protein
MMHQFNKKFKVRRLTDKMSKKERELKEQNELLRELIEGMDQIKEGKTTPLK